MDRAQDRGAGSTAGLCWVGAKGQGEEEESEDGGRDESDELRLLSRTRTRAGDRSDAFIDASQRHGSLRESRISKGGADIERKGHDRSRKGKRPVWAGVQR